MHTKVVFLTSNPHIHSCLLVQRQVRIWTSSQPIPISHDVLPFLRLITRPNFREVGVAGSFLFMGLNTSLGSQGTQAVFDELLLNQMSTYNFGK